jgi:hypothetical protein
VSTSQFLALQGNLRVDFPDFVIPGACRNPGTPLNYRAIVLRQQALLAKEDLIKSSFVIPAKAGIQ